MNRDAASETQYEDSKSQLSTHRKDDKIMLKRKVLTLLLVLVLVVSMAVPASAKTFAGTHNGKTYTFAINDYNTSATGTFTYDVDTKVSIYIQMSTWCSTHQSEYYTDTASGYGDHGHATATVDCIVNGHQCYTATGTYNGYVNGGWIASRTY